MTDTPAASRRGVPYTWILPSLAVGAVGAVGVLELAALRPVPATVVFVGSVATTGALHCEARVRSDPSRDPPVIVLAGGMLSGLDVLRDTDLRSPPGPGSIDLVGTSVGVPEVERLRAGGMDPRQDWVAFPIDERYPLGLVTTVEGEQALAGASVPCSEPLRQGGAAARCLRPSTVRDTLHKEHEGRSGGAHGWSLLVPDSGGGVWAAMDRLVWPRGQDATPEWIEPDARWTLDYGDVASRPRPLAFGLPSEDRTVRDAHGAPSCGLPASLRELGVCASDDAAASCAPARVSLYGYTRVPAECAPRSTCHLRDALCGVLGDIYAAVGNDRGTEFVHRKCELRYEPGVGVLRPL